MGKAFHWLPEEKREEVARSLFDVQSKKGPWLNGLNPFKQEQNPSFGYNIEKDYYKAFNSDDSGDLLDLYRKVKGYSFREGIKAFKEEYQVDEDTFKERAATKTHKRKKYSPANGMVLTEDVLTYDILPLEPRHFRLLRSTRGITAEAIREHMIGYYRPQKRGTRNKRIAIPIYVDGYLVNVRLYNSGLDPKMKSWGKGFGTTRLFPDTRYIKKDELVLLCEGEPDTLCARSQGLNAFTFTGGCNSIPTELLDCFSGLDVVIAYDADQPGQNAAEKLAETLIRIAKSVHVIDWPACMGFSEKHGQDLTDYFMKHGGSVEKLGDLAKRYVIKKEPYPLRRTLPPATEFPLEVLPPVLVNYIGYLSRTIQCPVSIAAQSVLAVASLAVQGQVDVMIDGRSFPSSLFLITIASSGERKTATDNIALAPVRAHEEKLRQKSRAQQPEFQARLLAWEKTRNQVLSCKDNDTVEKKTAAILALGEAPKMLVDNMLTTEEPTYEGLIVKLNEGQPSVGIFSDEGARFVGGSGMSQDNMMKTAAGLSKLWDGSPITRTRVGGSFVLVGRRTSMHLMLQPKVAEVLLGNEMLQAQGLLSRLLISCPNSTIGSRPYCEADLQQAPEIQQYNLAISSLLERALPVKEGTINELEPRLLQLSAEAKILWVDFHDAIEAELAEGGLLFPIRSSAAKAAEHAARLSAVISVLLDPDTDEIGEPEMQAGIDLAEYYMAEALRLHASSEQEELVLAERCLKFLRERYPVFSTVELYQNGPNAVRNKAAAEQIVEILQEHGYIEEVKGGARVNGKKRNKAWKVLEVPASDTEQ